MSIFTRKENKPHTKKWAIVLWGGLFFLSLGLHLMARLLPGFAEWYAVAVYPIWVGSLGRFFSIFPFSVVEISIYLLVLIVLVGIAALLRKKLSLRTALKVMVKTGIVLFVLFTLNCGINYQRLTFSQRAGFSLQKSTEAELIALCEYLVEEINREAEGLTVDAQGHCLVEGDLAQTAREAMQTAAEEYPELRGYYPDAKPVFSSWYLSYQRLQGVYSPFTVEANYNRAMPDHDKPSTICHELSHLKGFMREDEANFVSYLACRVSDDREFRYSGNLMAFVYAGNALYAQNLEAFVEVRQNLCRQADQDLRNHNAYWDQYRGKVAEVSDKVNDLYLKANAQQDGVKSYGRMVDLLLAWNRERTEAQ